MAQHISARTAEVKAVQRLAGFKGTDFASLAAFALQLQDEAVEQDRRISRLERELDKLRDLVRSRGR